MHGQLVCVGYNSLEVSQDLALGQYGPIVLVEHVKPICARSDRSGSMFGVIQLANSDDTRTELTATEDDDVPCFGVALHPASPLR